MFHFASSLNINKSKRGSYHSPQCNLPYPWQQVTFECDIFWNDLLKILKVLECGLTVRLPGWSVCSKQDRCFINSLHFTLLALFLTHERSDGTPASHSTQSSQKTQLILNVHTSADTVCVNVTRWAICSAGANNELCFQDATVWHEGRALCHIPWQVI